MELRTSLLSLSVAVNMDASGKSDFSKWIPDIETIEKAMFVHLSSFLWLFDSCRLDVFCMLIHLQSFRKKTFSIKRKIYREKCVWKSEWSASRNNIRRWIVCVYVMFDVLSWSVYHLKAWRVEKVKVLPGARIQQQVWVWIPLRHLPSPSSFLPPPFLLCCLLGGAHPQQPGKKRQNKILRTADSRYSGSLSTVLEKVLILTCYAM